MKALICPNCGAADWKEENGYQVCTYCGTKIPLAENERTFGSEYIVGEWIAENVTYPGDLETLQIENDLTGLMIGVYPPNTMTTEEANCCIPDAKYVEYMTTKIHLYGRDPKHYVMMFNGITIKAYGNRKSSITNFPAIELGTVIQLSQNKIKTIIENNDTGEVEEVIYTRKGTESMVE